jgi:uncharacterized protein (TIGR02246 family)
MAKMSADAMQEVLDRPGEYAKQAIRNLFASYQQALNTSDLSLALSLYLGDGVFMMPHHPPRVGKPAIQEAYRELFNEVDHHVEVKVDEITLAGFEWAFARTTTTGTCAVRATGKYVPDAVQQLWVLKVPDPETDGMSWRIARYSFSPTSPSS